MSGTASAPGQVQNLVTGTPTTRTVPVTYSAPTTGGPVITYAGETSQDSGTTWKPNAGAFDATGGTFIGLDPSTTITPSIYSLRVVATNAAGATATAAPASVTMATSAETEKSFQELVVDAFTALSDVLKLTVGGLVVSSVTGTRVTLGAALAKFDDAVTALADREEGAGGSSGGSEA